jgi:hypothetical protein
MTNKLKEGAKGGGVVIEIKKRAAETIFMTRVLSVHSTNNLVATGVSFKRNNKSSNAN